MTNDGRQPPDQLKFVTTVLAEIARNNYEASVDTFLEGLRHLVTSRSIVSGEEFDYHLSGPLSALIKYKLQALEKSSTPSEAKEACCFCGKARGDVNRLIAGPDIFICDGCVRVCGTIIDETSNAKE